MTRSFGTGCRDIDQDTEAVATQVVECAFALHRELGPGLLERVYRTCLADDLRERGLQVAEEVAAPLVRKGNRYEGAYRIDLIVEDRVLLEVKAVEDVHPVHLAQLRTYLKLTGIELGFLLNFNSPRMVDGLRRSVLSR